MKPIIIAIDGFSSCGKSTLAKAIAKRLNYSYVDTGAMYRAVSLYILRKNLNWTTMSAVEINRLLDEVVITFQYNPELGYSETYLNKENVETEIRGKQVSEAVSEISQIKAIRDRMKQLQRIAGREKKVVMDGRDIGTNVFPEADLKLFMTADPEIRAKRRYDELIAKGQEPVFEEVLENIRLRDHNDTHRKENPLRKAVDAIEIDNSYLDEEEQLNLLQRIIAEKIN